MRYLCLLLLVGCRPAGHQRELAACELISKSGDDLARCLIIKYSWGADSAGPAKTRFQWMLDSLRNEHDAQAAAVLAEQQALDRRASLVRMAAENRAEHRRDSILAAIDSLDGECQMVLFPLSNDMSSEAYRRQNARCQAEHNARRKRAGLPPDTLES